MMFLRALVAWWKRGLPITRCRTCKGTGEVHYRERLFGNGSKTFHCVDCKGKGWK